MIPPTINKLPALACVSAVQKCIRRGLEKEAMEFAVELIHTSKALSTMLCNRLIVTCNEDIDNLGQPHIFPFVEAACRQALEKRKPEKMGETRLFIGNAIRMMARADKSREGCHFAASVGLRSQLEGYVPEIPDWAWDVHTLQGKRMGRGLSHFLEEGAKLVPPQKKADAYQAEAVRLWQTKYTKK